MTQFSMLILAVGALGFGAGTLGACGGSTPAGDKGGPVGDDTGSSGDDTGGNGPCLAEILEIDPIDGAADIYYRGSLGAIFTEDGSSADFSLVDSEGTDVPVTASFDETGLNATVSATDGMSAGIGHTFTVVVCEDSQSVNFTTSVYGGDLEITPEGLEGVTYNFSMATADYLQPPTLGAVLGNFLDAPLLVMVEAADSAEITLLGAQGLVDDVTGEVTQDTSLASWDFGTASFALAPTFETDPAQVVIDYGGVDIILHNFEMSGTFEPDGSSVGHGHALALGDTRYMGPLFEQGDDPGAVCEFAASLGLECETCPDGNDYCMTIEAEFEPAMIVDGLVVVEVD